MRGRYAVAGCLAATVVLSGAAPQGEVMPERLPEKMTGVFYKLQVGDLTAVIGDHHDHGSGRPGYTAVRHLSHKAFPYSCFRPRFAGLLHTRGNRKVDVLRISDREVVITPTWATCGHWERFVLTEPHYVDYEYSFYATKSVHWVNWCCYMNRLLDPGIYLMQNGQWIRHYSAVHSINASVAPNTMKELPPFRKVANSRYPSGYASFADTFAPYRFDADRSFYFGRFHDLAFIWMFCRGDDILPYMSPTGGGGPNNPAWDARYWLRDCRPGEKVSLKMRVALKPFVSNDDCLAEYVKWRRLLDSGKFDGLRYPLWDVRSPRVKTFLLAKPTDRPFEVQVFKTQLAVGSNGRVVLVGPDGVSVATCELNADGDQHRRLYVKPDGKTGVYRLRIDADDRSCWNVVTDLYRESVAVDKPVTFGRRVSGRRFYFRVPEGLAGFRIDAAGKGGTLVVYSPDGEEAGSLRLGQPGTLRLRIGTGQDDALWSLSFDSRDDVTLALAFSGSSVRPVLSAYAAGQVTDR